MKITGFLSIISTCFTLFSASANAEELILNTQDFYPFSYMEDGKVSGPAVEVIQRVCKEIDIKCSFNLLVWTRAQKELEAGKVHGLFLIGWNEEREKSLFFSPPLLQTSYGFFVNADNLLKYQKPSDVSGYTVGVYGPSNTSHSLEKIRDQISKKGLKPLNIDMRPDHEDGFRKLSIKRIQAVYSNHDVGNAMIKKLALNNIRYAGFEKRLKYYIGFSKKNTDERLVDRFNKAFGKLYQSGEIGRILVKYHMKEVPQNEWGKR